MERQIGEIFEYNGTKLEVVEDYTCDKCFFNNNNNCFRFKYDFNVFCSGPYRNDGKYVSFKKVKESWIDKLVKYLKLNFN